MMLVFFITALHRAVVILLDGVVYASYMWGFLFLVSDFLNFFCCGFFFFFFLFFLNFGFDDASF